MLPEQTKRMFRGWTFAFSLDIRLVKGPYAETAGTLETARGETESSTALQELNRFLVKSQVISGTSKPERYSLFSIRFALSESKNRSVRGSNSRV